MKAAVGRKATLPLGLRATRPRMKAAGSLPADLSLARKKSDPAAGSDKAAKICHLDFTYYV
ncbi:MAG: hypothetical protein AUJ34_03080 [Parcubacteria group bacterium CG1_02_41_12]|nr:MAG: hypothetical protein AUJ34_03080 [Parcubacteria group bacterium CG1_02_41_12]